MLEKVFSPFHGYCNGITSAISSRRVVTANQVYISTNQVLQIKNENKQQHQNQQRKQINGNTA